jgi:hypothetical protein
VIAITDIPSAICKNEIGLAKVELCPSPETDLNAAREPFAALFENPDSTRKLSTCSRIGSAANLKLFTCSLTTNGPGQHTRKCTPNSKIQH